MPNVVAYVKHLVECNCLLPQFKHSNPPKWHHFIVFSEIDDKGEIVPSFAQCNNCGVIHKVLEVCVSSMLKRDSLPSLVTSKELMATLPEKLQKDLERYKPDLPTLQEISWIFEHQAWGRGILLTKEEMDGIVVGKTLLILGETLWKIQPFQDEGSNDE